MPYLSICIPANVPAELSAIDDELKVIHHSHNSFCVWVFQTAEERNRFVVETGGMAKAERELVYTQYATSTKA